MHCARRLHHSKDGPDLCRGVLHDCTATLLCIPSCGVIQQLIHGLISRHEGARHPAQHIRSQHHNMRTLVKKSTQLIVTCATLSTHTHTHHTRPDPPARPRYAGIGGLSEVLGWTEVQQEENKGGFFGGANNVLALVALVLFADLALFGCVRPLPLLQLLPCTADVALFVCGSGRVLFWHHQLQHRCCSCCAGTSTCMCCLPAHPLLWVSEPRAGAVNQSSSD